jgi:tricarballylate dehydrogenase
MGADPTGLAGGEGEMDDRADVIVVGFGAAGLAATLAAVEAVIAAEQRDARIVVLERATRDDRGGNTRWSTATFRMKDPKTLNDDFVEAFGPRTRDAEAYVQVLADRAVDTLGWVIDKGLVFNPEPDLYMTSDDPRIWPEGAGSAIVDVLGGHVEEAARGRFFGPDGGLAVGVEVMYETTARSLLLDDEGRVAGLEVRTRDGVSERIESRCVVLASGGFQGNPEMMTRYVGFDVPPISIGGRHNKGEGIEMALAVGAGIAGQWNEYHPLPADPRTGRSGLMTFAAVMQTVPYSILVDVHGERFMDEGADSMDHLYDVVGRAVQLRPEQTAFAVFDSKVRSIPGYERAVAKDMVEEPVQADTIEDLATRLGIPPGHLVDSVAAFNAATPSEADGFDPTRKDGVATSGLTPAKSNWARRIDAPPYFAFPVTCANVFTLGGIATNEAAEVVDRDGVAIPGLFAAGELTGLYHHDYVGATSVLRALVFGRIAGEGAVRHALGS